MMRWRDIKEAQILVLTLSEVCLRISRLAIRETRLVIYTLGKPRSYRNLLVLYFLLEVLQCPMTSQKNKWQAQGFFSFWVKSAAETDASALGRPTSSDSGSALSTPTPANAAFDPPAHILAFLPVAEKPRLLNGGRFLKK